MITLIFRLHLPLETKSKKKKYSLRICVLLSSYNCSAFMCSVFCLAWKPSPPPSFKLWEISLKMTSLMINVVKTWQPDPITFSYKGSKRQRSVPSRSIFCEILLMSPLSPTFLWFLPGLRLWALGRNKCLLTIEPEQSVGSTRPEMIVLGIIVKISYRIGWISTY